MHHNITSLYAALAGLILIILSFRVMGLRQRKKVVFGDGGVPELTHAIRAHGNFVEYVPIALILILLVESSGGANGTVHGLGIGLILARLLHIWGVLPVNGPFFARGAGIILTMLVILGAAARLLYNWI
jgi:uncharacterized membrane protein YecN with MAPEG domain